MNAQTAMVCAYCGRDKSWPRDFPVRTLARCGHCTQRHIEQNAKVDHEVIVGALLVSIILIVALVSYVLADCTL